MEDDPKKKMEDHLNFKAVLLRLFNNKNLKNKWFYTIEIDLVCYSKWLKQVWITQLTLYRKWLSSHSNLFKDISDSKLQVPICRHL
jgi:hypothetical protein